MNPSKSELQRRWVKFDDRFATAATLRDSGRADEALRILLDLVAEDPSFAPGWLVIGGIRMSAGEHREALRAFDRILADHPKSERASLGRFHCLWSLGDEDGAFGEMRRFLEIADSKEYRRLLDEMSEEVARRANGRPS